MNIFTFKWLLADELITKLQFIDTENSCNKEWSRRDTRISLRRKNKIDFAGGLKIGEGGSGWDQVR